MHDIFLSYSREDRGRIRPIVDLLEAQGWSVWWDREIPKGRQWAAAIEEAIESSRTMVVVWTEASVSSDWVRTEANEGMKRAGGLIPIRLDDVKAKIEFRRLQEANLTDWDGAGNHPEIDATLRTLRSVLGSGQTTGAPDVPKTQAVDGPRPQLTEPVVLVGHIETVTEVLFSPDRSRVLTAGQDGIARLWTLDGDCMAEMGDGSCPDIYIHYNPDGSRILTSSRGARLWDSEGNEIDAELARTDYSYIKMSPDGTRIVTAGYRRPMGIWDARDGRALAQTCDSDYEGGARFSPDGSLFAVGSRSGPIRVFSSKNGSLVVELFGLKGWVAVPEFSPDGRLVIGGAQDDSVHVWEVSTGHELLRLGESIGTGWSVTTFSSDGSWILTLSRGDKVARVWETETGWLGGELADPEARKNASWSTGGGIERVRFSPDGRQILTLSQDHSSRLWNTASGREVAHLAPGQEVLNAIVSPDGSMVATAGTSGITLWSSGDGRYLRDLTGHSDDVLHLCFNHDGSLLGSGSFDRTARIWPI